jgi:hypothetical protein
MLTEEKLTAADRKIVREEIKASIRVGIVFLLFGALILFLAFGASLVHISISHIFMVRMISVFCIYFLVVLFVWFSYFQHYMDLIKGAKIKLHLHRYELIVKKRRTYLISMDWQEGQHEHLEIEEEMLPHITLNRPLMLELGKRSNVILFISHDTDNYLHKISANI